MKSRKIKTTLSTGIFLLFTTGFLSGCGSEQEEAVPESKEITTEPIQDVETIIEPTTSIDGNEETAETETFEYGGLDDQKNLEAETDSMEGILDELSGTASDSLDAAEEAVTETTDTMMGIAEDEVASVEDTIAEIQEDATTTLESAIEEPMEESIAQMAEDAEEVVAATPDLTRRVQQALANAGYNPGPADGISGPRTLEALKNFQEDNNLAAGELTKETLRALGVSF